MPQRPVDIQKIRQRIRKEHYRSIKDLEADVNLMCSNTQQYNIDGSLIYEDSVILKSVFSSAKESMEKDGTLPPDGNATKRAAESMSTTTTTAEQGGGEEVPKKKEKKRKKKKKNHSSDEENEEDSDYSDWSLHNETCSFSLLTI